MRARSTGLRRGPTWGAPASDDRDIAAAGRTFRRGNAHSSAEPISDFQSRLTLGDLRRPNLDPLAKRLLIRPSLSPQGVSNRIPLLAS